MVICEDYKIAREESKRSDQTFKIESSSEPTRDYHNESQSGSSGICLIL